MILFSFWIGGGLPYCLGVRDIGQVKNDLDAVLGPAAKEVVAGWMSFQSAPAAESLEPRAGDCQFGCEQPVKARVDRKFGYYLDLQHSPIACRTYRLLPRDDIRRLLDTLDYPPQPVEIEFPRTHPIRIAALQRLERGGGKAVNGLALEERSVPCLVAIDALIDEPGIEALAIGVEPDLAARSEEFWRSAAAAGDPWLRRCFGRKGPTDLKNIAHTVLVFRLEVHQAGGETSPSGRGMAMLRDG